MKGAAKNLKQINPPLRCFQYVWTFISISVHIYSIPNYKVKTFIFPKVTVE